MGQMGYMYQFFHNNKEYLVKVGVNESNKKVRPARVCVQEAASIIQKI